VGWWPAEGNAREIIGGITGTVYSGTAYLPGMVGQAFSFDGTNGCVMNTNSTPYTNIQNTFTMEFWAYPQRGFNIMPEGGGLGNSGQSYAIFPDWGGSSSSGPAGAGVCVGTNGISVVEHCNNYMPSSLSYTNLINGWTHIAVVYSNKQPTLYVNGIKVRTGVTSPETFVYPSKNFGGSYSTAAGFQFKTYGPYKGLLDEVTIYNRALASNEVASIYNAGIGGKCVPVPPAIYTQPTNQAVVAGGVVNFSVAAAGTAPLSYQWRFGGTNLAGATNTTLTLTNVQMSQAGNYSVAVTNFYGAVLSSNALLTVAVGMDHFTLSPIPSPRFVNTPFAVSIQARNPANGVFTNFTGTAILDSTNGVAITPPVSGSFIQGVWTGSVVIAQTASNLVLRAGDGLGHFGFANSVNVIGLPRLGMVRSGNIVMFLWPVGYSGFVLEASGRLSPAAWVAVPYSPIQIGDQYMLPLDLTGTNGFYRLRLPGN
jgi:hypothetical protein